jgi:hypothetical protein
MIRVPSRTKIADGGSTQLRAGDGKTVDGVLKELIVYALVYNLVRAVAAWSPAWAMIADRSGPPLLAETPLWMALRPLIACTQMKEVVSGGPTRAMASARPMSALRIQSR